MCAGLISLTNAAFLSFPEVTGGFRIRLHVLGTFAYSYPVSCLTSQARDCLASPSWCIVLVCLLLLPSCCRCFFFLPTGQQKLFHSGNLSILKFLPSFCCVFLEKIANFCLYRNIFKWSECGLHLLCKNYIFLDFEMRILQVSKLFSNNKCIVVFLCLGIVNLCEMSLWEIIKF